VNFTIVKGDEIIVLGGDKLKPTTLWKLENVEGYLLRAKLITVMEYALLKGCTVEELIRNYLKRGKLK
jgi:hypothetical protein